MKNRDKRKNIAADTLKILDQGSYISTSGQEINIAGTLQKAIENTRTYTPLESDLLIQDLSFLKRSYETEIIVSKSSTLAAALQMKAADLTNVLCLNFASAKNPGGGFLGGSQAQEESLARSSGLYPCLLASEAYYSTNRNTSSCFYTDYMVYSPSVPVFKDDAGNYLDQSVEISFLTAPAVNTGVVKRREPNRIEEIETVMRRRIDKVLAIAATNGYTHLILGAWGCGVFQNDPVLIAKYFRDSIEGKFKYVFQKTEFAIYSRNEKFITPFLEAFS